MNIAQVHKVYILYVKLMFKIDIFQKPAHNIFKEKMPQL
jgi:hypothetical protein